MYLVRLNTRCTLCVCNFCTKKCQTSLHVANCTCKQSTGMQGDLHMMTAAAQYGMPYVMHLQARQPVRLHYILRHVTLCCVLPDSKLHVKPALCCAVV